MFPFQTAAAQESALQSPAPRIQWGPQSQALTPSCCRRWPCHPWSHPSARRSREHTHSEKDLFVPFPPAEIRRDLLLPKTESRPLRWPTEKFRQKVHDQKIQKTLSFPLGLQKHLRHRRNPLISLHSYQRP